jgi:hypothetical protein
MCFKNIFNKTNSNSLLFICHSTRESIQSRLLLLKTLQEKKVTLEHEISRSVERIDNCVNKNAVNSAVVRHQDLEVELDRIHHQIIEGEAELQRHYFVQNILAEEDEGGRK